LWDDDALDDATRLDAVERFARQLKIGREEPVGNR